MPARLETQTIVSSSGPRGRGSTTRPIGALAAPVNSALYANAPLVDGSTASARQRLGVDWWPATHPCTDADRQREGAGALVV